MRYSLLLGITVCVVTAFSAAAQASYQEDFEGAQTSFQLLDLDINFRVTRHERTQDVVRSGRGAETIAFEGTSGTKLMFGAAVPHSTVISDLKPSLWVKGERPGAQIVVRIVFPRFTDANGIPATMLLGGSTYQQAGRWQQLTMGDLKADVERRTAALRAQYGPEFDPREAYVDIVGLNLYAGPGLTEYWFDDLELTGQLTPQGEKSTVSVSLRSGSPRMEEIGTPPVSVVSRDGNLLLVDNQPLAHRVIDYHGEPLPLLRQLGFNAIRINRKPDEALLYDLQRNGMTFIAPPPPQGTLDGAYQRLLAWQIPTSERAEDFPDFALTADDVRRADQGANRPILAAPTNSLYEHSRFADIILHNVPMIGGSSAPAELSGEIEKRSLFCSQTTAHWSVIETDYPDETRRQLQALSSLPQISAAIEADQMQQQLFLAASGGARGFIYTSRSSLADERPVNEYRRAALELANRRLALVEPWIAAADQLTSIPTVNPTIQATLLSTPTAKLLIVVRSVPGDQFTVAPPYASALEIQVPGIPTDSEPYLLHSSGLQQMQHSRRSGGMRLVLHDQSRVALIVLTQDPIVLRDMRRRIEENGRRITELQYEIAQQTLELARDVTAQLRGGDQVANTQIASAWGDLREAQRGLEVGSIALAEKKVNAAMNSLEQVQRLQWERTIAQYYSPLTNPLTISYDLLPLALQLQSRLAIMEPSANRLAGGDMEDLTFLLATGWRQTEHPSPGVKLLCELTSTDVKDGNYALHLGVFPENELTPVLAGAAPLKIDSGVVDVQPGQLLLIRGWVKVRSKTTPGKNALLIYDSLGGKRLGLHLPAIDQWQEFSLIRAADQPGTMRLTFEMTGFAEATLDDVTVELYEQRRRQSRPTPQIDNEAYIDDAWLR
ncbi:hypothetical protein LOC68_15060 [Blastopirellula sp. JC732]|uniref:Uncharacterized protein n=1 Tax=Blastopirellula sediminis TaxID=2894196 RepID=A0A9X1SHD0_9BACT|nr:hypothetical protein [Blastopirellula sediminis]MCC9606994.1 hypothetical protein [Blastopirellula sediminis]MCC9629711.1 hypothetical protein [Blastopirellula sediminis]